MIKDVSTESSQFVVNPSLLRDGEVGDGFLLVKRANLKFDVNNNLYMQLSCRGANGQVIPCYVFDERIIEEFRDSINKLTNAVIAVGYYVKTVYDKKSLELTMLTLPKDGQLSNAKADLFELIVPEIDGFYDGFIDLFKTYETPFTEALSGIFETGAFTKLRNRSDEKIINGADGYVYAMLKTIAERLRVYETLKLLDKKSIGIMLNALLMAEVILAYHSNTDFSYTMKVFTDVNALLKNKVYSGNVGTDGERSLLNEVVTGYLNNRLGVESKTESRLSHIMYNEYKSFYESLKFLSGIPEGTMVSMNDKMIR